MRNEQRKKRFKIFLSIFTIIAISFVTVFVVCEIIKKSKIKNFDIDINAQNCTNTSQIAEYLKNKNINYFAFKQDDLIRELKKKFFCIGSLEARVSYPDYLKLIINGRQGYFVITEITSNLSTNPIVKLPEDSFKEASESTKPADPIRNLDMVLENLKQASNSAKFLVDKEGVIFEKATESQLPLISILGFNLEEGKSIPEGIIEKVAIIYQGLKKINAPTDNIIVIGDKIIVNSKPRIVFSLIRPLDRQTASLQLILAQSKMNSDPRFTGSNNIESIDLRFEKPVVIYEKK